MHGQQKNIEVTYRNKLTVNSASCCFFFCTDLTTLLNAKIMYRYWQINKIRVSVFGGMILRDEDRSTERRPVPVATYAPKAKH